LESPPPLPPPPPSPHNVEASIGWRPRREEKNQSVEKRAWSKHERLKKKKEEETGHAPKVKRRREADISSTWTHTHPPTHTHTHCKTDGERWTPWCDLQVDVGFFARGVFHGSLLHFESFKHTHTEHTHTPCKSVFFAGCFLSEKCQQWEPSLLLPFLMTLVEPPPHWPVGGGERLPGHGVQLMTARRETPPGA